MAHSAIEWTESTWNPLTGCTKFSAGCKNCYAERMAMRLQAMGQKRYINGFDLTLHPDSLEIPLKWKKPQMIFVNSMSDLFHKDVPVDFIQEVFAVMNQAHWHTFQVLTKRAERLASIAGHLRWSPNIWMGVSIESSDCLFRAEQLKTTGAHVKFLSLEPLLGPLEALNLFGIDWVIVGGESGSGARPMEISWVRQIRGNCLNSRVPFFFKQWGGIRKNRTGRLLDGRTWDELPNQYDHLDAMQLNHSLKVPLKVGIGVGSN